MSVIHHDILSQKVTGCHNSSNKTLEGVGQLLAVVQAGCSKMKDILVHVQLLVLFMYFIYSSLNLILYLELFLRCSGNHDILLFSGPFKFSLLFTVKYPGELFNIHYYSESF